MRRDKGTAGIVSSEYSLVFIIKDNALKKAFGMRGYFSDNTYHKLIIIAI